MTLPKGGNHIAQTVCLGVPPNEAHLIFKRGLSYMAERIILF